MKQRQETRLKREVGFGDVPDSPRYMKPMGGEFYEISKGKEPGWQSLLHSSSSKLSYFSSVSVSKLF